MPSGISKPKKIMVKLTSGGKSPLIVQKGSQVEKAVELLIRGHTRKFIEEHKGIPRNIIWHARQRLDKIGAHIPTKAVHRTMLLKATPESARGALRLYNADLSSKQVGQLAGINARLARKLDTTHRALKRHEARHLAMKMFAKGADTKEINRETGVPFKKIPALRREFTKGEKQRRGWEIIKLTRQGKSSGWIRRKALMPSREVTDARAKYNAMIERQFTHFRDRGLQRKEIMGNMKLTRRQYETLKMKYDKAGKGESRAR